MSSTPRASIVPWEPKLEMVLSKIPQTKGELSWFRRRERNRLTSPSEKQSGEQHDQEDKLPAETDAVALKTAKSSSTLGVGATKDQLREGLIESHDHIQVDDVKKSTKFGDRDQPPKLVENECKPEKKSSSTQDDKDCETPVQQARRTIKVVAKQKKKESESLPAAPTNPFANVSLATSGHAPPLFGGGGFESLGKAQPTLSAAKSSSMVDVGATKDQLREGLIESHDRVQVDDVKKSTKFGDRDQASQLEENEYKPEKKSSSTQDDKDCETPVQQARRTIKVVAKQKKKESESLPAAPTNPFANVSLATSGHAPPLFGGGGFESLGKAQPTLSAAKSSSTVDVGATDDHLREGLIESYDRVQVDDVEKSTKFGDRDEYKPEKKSSSTQDDKDGETPVPQARRTIKVVAKQKKKESESLPAAPTNPFANVSLATSGHVPPLFGGGGFESLGKVDPIFGFGSSTFGINDAHSDCKLTISGTDYGRSSLPREGTTYANAVVNDSTSSTPIHSTSPSHHQALNGASSLQQFEPQDIVRPNGPSSENAIHITQDPDQCVHRDRLIAFYKVHNPAKLCDVEKLLKKYRGREEALFRRIEDVYKVDVGLAVTDNDRLLKAVTIVAPASKQLMAVQGIEDQMSDDELLRVVDGDLNDEQRENLRLRLVAFYKRHNESKVDSVGMTLEKFRGREATMLMKLREKYVTVKAELPIPGGMGPTCFFDIEIASLPIGTVEFRLYNDKVPLAAENFRALCTGEKGIGINSAGKPLCYRNSLFHRIVPDFCVQGGDFTKNDGTGGTSIYPPNSEHGDMWGKFKDEQFMGHTRKGLLSMANNGPNRNGSQFFVTLRATPHLDKTHVVFGEVTRGINIIEQMAQVAVDCKQRPIDGVRIADCGQIMLDGTAVRASAKVGTKGFTMPLSFSSGEPVGSWNLEASSAAKPSPFLFGTSPKQHFSASQKTGFFGGPTTSASLSSSQATSPATNERIIPSSFTFQKRPPSSSILSLVPSGSEHPFATAESVNTLTPQPGTLLESSPVGESKQLSCKPRDGNTQKESDWVTDDGSHQPEIELKDQHRKKLVAFYEAHKPEKLQDVDRLLKKFKGREDEMYKRLFEVYHVNLKSEAPQSDTSHALPKSALEFPNDPSTTAGARIDPQSDEGSNESPRGRRIEVAPDVVLASGGRERDRLVRFYEKHNPSKLEEIDRILEAYEGQSDLLYQRLSLKYNVPCMDGEMRNILMNSNEGDKPSDDNNENESDWVTDDGAHQPEIELKDQHRKKLVAFYEAHKPEKLQDVDRLLKKFKGREDEMYKRLFEVYHVNLKSEAPQSNTSHALPKSTLEFASYPSTTAGARIDPQSDEGSNESPRGRRIEVAPDVVLASGGRERDRLVRFYEKHNPSKLEEIDRILEAYEGQSDLLYQRLSLKYNVPCIDGEMRSILMTSNEGDKPSDDNNENESDWVTDDEAHQPKTELKDQHRKKLVAFYEAHKPEKLQDVDRLLKKFKGREDEMYKRLFEVYHVNLKSEAPQSDTSHALPKSALEFPNDPSTTAGARIDPQSDEGPQGSPGRRKTEFVPKFVEEPYSYSIDFPENSANKALDLASAIPPPPTLASGGVGSLEEMMLNAPLLNLEEPKERPRHVVADHEPIAPLMNTSSCERLVAMDEIKCASELMDTKQSPQKVEARQDHPFETIGKTQKLGLPPKSSGSADEAKKMTTPKHVAMALPKSSITESTRKATVPTLIAVPSPRGYQRYADGCGSERDRLVLFYEKYNPSKLEEIDKILEAYEGQSDLMYQRLSKKYNVPMKDDGMSGTDISLLGDTPFDFVSALDSTREVTGRDDPRLQRERLAAFYEKHNPAKLLQVDQILKAYQGDDRELKKLMSSKSSPSKVSKVRVAQVDSCRSPLKMSTVGCAPIEPQLSREQHRDVMRHRLISFYKIHNPSQIESVDQLLESYRGRENLLFRKLRQNIDSNVTDTEPVLPSSIQTQVMQETQSNASMSVALYPDTPTLLKEKGLAPTYPFDVSQKDVSPSSKHGPDASATTAVEKGGTAASIHSSFLSPRAPSPSNVFVQKVTNQAAPSCSSDEPQSAQQVIESGPCAREAPLKLPPNEESKCLPTLGKSSLASTVKPIPPSRPFVGQVEVSRSNPFATKALNGSPLTSRKTNFLDRFPISHNNPFSKTSEEACPPGRTVNVPFSSFRSVSSGGSQFLEDMKASKDNPFAKPTSVASPLTKNASSFLREVKPSMNNPFAPGSAGLVSKPPMPSIGLDSRKASSRITEDARTITENLIVTSIQQRQAAADPAFAPPPPREGCINASTSLSVSASSNAASIPASFGSGFWSSAESSSNASSTPPKQALQGRSSLAEALAATPAGLESKTKDYSFETWYSESDDDEVSHVKAPVGRVAVASDHGTSGLLVKAKAKGKK